MTTNRSASLGEVKKSKREKIIEEFKLIAEFAHRSHNSFEKVLRARKSSFDLKSYEDYLDKNQFTLFTKPSFHLHDRLTIIDIYPVYNKNVSNGKNHLDRNFTMYMSPNFKKKSENKKRKAGSEMLQEDLCLKKKKSIDSRTEITMSGQAQENSFIEQNAFETQISTEISVTTATQVDHTELQNNPGAIPAQSFTFTQSFHFFSSSPRYSPIFFPENPFPEDPNKIPTYVELEAFFPVKKM